MAVSGMAEIQTQASTLEYKTVNEVWDKKEYTYKIVDSLKSPNELTELDRYIFVVRTRIDKETKHQIKYVDVKSENIRDMLREVLQNAPGTSLDEDKISIEQNLLYHYSSDIEGYGRALDAVAEKTARQHVKLFVDYIQTAYAPITARLLPLLKKQQITYDLLWALFKPNSQLYTKCFGTGRSRCVRYELSEEKKTRSGVEYLHIKAHCLDFDGKVFGEVPSDHTIEKFRGTKQITALEVFPFDFHGDKDRVTAQLTECGRRFLSLRKMEICTFQGQAFYMHKKEVVKIHIESRVVVDVAHFREENPNYSKRIPQHSKFASLESRTVSEDESDEDEEEHDDVCHERRRPQPTNKRSDPSNIAIEDLLICSPTIAGFALANGIWVELAVADIQMVEWKANALGDLHISVDKKEAIKAVSEAYVKRKPTTVFDDVVKGKGQGFCVLLHGPTGVGKTLTAELLAEHLQRPLMPVSAGELGTMAETVEQRLSLIFRRASRWKAVLLLDEADVFLEQQYYQGMLFLTTNRLRQIDDAVTSRVHFKLNYGQLSQDQRRNVWLGFLRRASTPEGKAKYSNEDLERLVSAERNGREIKNIVATAHALAISAGQQLTIFHLATAIAASDDFKSDFEGILSTQAVNSFYS